MISSTPAPRVENNAINDNNDNTVHDDGNVNYEGVTNVPAGMTINNNNQQIIQPQHVMGNMQAIRTQVYNQQMEEQQHHLRQQMNAYRVEYGVEYAQHNHQQQFNPMESFGLASSYVLPGTAHQVYDPRMQSMQNMQMQSMQPIQPMQPMSMQTLPPVYNHVPSSSFVQVPLSQIPPPNDGNSVRPTLNSMHSYYPQYY